MPGCYYLKSKDVQHPSWANSVTRSAVRVFANDEAQARSIAAKTLQTLMPGYKPPSQGKYEKIVLPPSPWEDPNVTSCEEYSGTFDGRNVVADSGEKWEAKL
jgi:hypothetical protein